MGQSWLTGIFEVFLGLIVLTHCVPVEIVYTGDACECPSTLDYQIHVPRCSKPKKLIPNDYGYKVDVPIQAKAKISYSFDFVVEEPKTPRPPKQSKWNLYAKVDRIAVNKPDCDVNYIPPPPPPPPPTLSPKPCKCGECGYSKPLYRYVYKRIMPCKCQQVPKGKCTCNNKCACNQNSINAIRQQQNAIENSSNSIRRRRDLRALFRPRKIEKDRTPRFVKQYQKNLLDAKRAGYSSLENAAAPITQHPKRKTKKAFFSKVHAPFLRVRRDIMGEYDMLERERDEMDLTIPEIIQFMPETLRPNYKRGRCNIGCMTRRQHSNNLEQTTIGYNDNKISETTTEGTTNDKLENQNRNEQYDRSTENPTRNNIQIAYKKRDTIQYSKDSIPQRPNHYQQRNPLAERAAQIQHSCSQQRQQQSQPPPSPPSKEPQRLPTLQQQPPSSQTPQPPQAPPLQSTPQQYKSEPKYVYDQLGSSYIENNGRLRMLVSAVPIPDPTGNAPLQFAGDLEGPPLNEYRTQNPAATDYSNYPVEHISNDELDKVISSIVYRHPDFIDASSHYGGGLTDPEEVQVEQTKSLLKKLIDGRLNILLGKGDEESDQVFDADYETYPTEHTDVWAPLQVFKLFSGYFG